MKQFIFPLLLLLFFIIAGTIESEDALTEEQIYDYIVKCEIKCPDVVWKQALLESGHFTSRLYREDKNIFGMKKAYNRPTTAIGRNKNGAAIYYNYRHAIIDYKLWQDKYYKGGDYYKFLSRVYAEDSVYVRKLRCVK